MSEPTIIHLMRHGTPVLSGCFLGHTDCAVTAEGIDACRAAAEGLRFGGLVASDLQRAARSAAAIADDRGIVAQMDSRWRELDFGDWDGRRAAGIDAAALGRFWADPDLDPPPHGERWSALTMRIGTALAAIDTDTLVVTHAGAMRAALAVACGFGRDQAWAFDLPYACVLSLKLWRGAASGAQIVALRP